MNAEPPVDVVVPGHRDLFGTPRAIHQAGLLRYLVTDFYVGAGSPLSPLRPLLHRGPTQLRKLLARDSGLPARHIVANNLLGLWAWRALRNAHGAGAAAAIHSQHNAGLTNTYARRCQPPADIVVGYRNSDVLFDSLPSSTKRVLCQNDGGAHEVEVVQDAVYRSPEWHPSPAHIRSLQDSGGSPWLAAERARLKREWALSSKIVCWSEWCVECVRQDGVDPAKCVVIPPMFDPSPAYATVTRAYDKDPFTVIFLGTLCIRKGTHDLIEAVGEAARERPVRLVLAGTNTLNSQMLARFSHCIEHRGFVPHSELPKLFSEGHVLALPSYSEGFGLVQVEAMAAGLPVIRSQNSGNAARHELEGLVVQAGDRKALTAAILRMATDRDLLRHWSAAATRRASDFSMQACADNWAACIESVASS
jgi:glycosyltransferase involved in cell wall biosynthesis